MEEVRRLMAEGLSFEEARLELVLGQMRRCGADASGMPSDPKAFTFQHAGQPRARPIGAGAVPLDAGRAGEASPGGAGAVQLDARRAKEASPGGAGAVQLDAWKDKETSSFVQTVIKAKEAIRAKEAIKAGVLQALTVASQTKLPRLSLSSGESTKWKLPAPGALGVPHVARMRKADKWFFVSALLFLALVPLVMFRLESWASPMVPRTLVQEARLPEDAAPLWPPVDSLRR